MSQDSSETQVKDHATFFRDLRAATEDLFVAPPATDDFESNDVLRHIDACLTEAVGVSEGAAPRPPTSDYLLSVLIPARVLAVDVAVHLQRRFNPTRAIDLSVWFGFPPHCVLPRSFFTKRRAAQIAVAVDEQMSALTTLDRTPDGALAEVTPVLPPASPVSQAASSPAPQSAKRKVKRGRSNGDATSGKGRSSGMKDTASGASAPETALPAATEADLFECTEVRDVAACIDDFVQHATRRLFHPDEMNEDEAAVTPRTKAMDRTRRFTGVQGTTGYIAHLLWENYGASLVAEVFRGHGVKKGLSVEQVRDHVARVHDHFLQAIYCATGDEPVQSAVVTLLRMCPMGSFGEFAIRAMVSRPYHVGKLLRSCSRLCLTQQSIYLLQREVGSWSVHPADFVNVDTLIIAINGSSDGALRDILHAAFLAKFDNLREVDLSDNREAVDSVSSRCVWDTTTMERFGLFTAAKLHTFGLRFAAARFIDPSLFSRLAALSELTCARFVLAGHHDDEAGVDVVADAAEGQEEEGEEQDDDAAEEVSDDEDASQPGSGAESSAGDAPVEKPKTLAERLAFAADHCGGVLHPDDQHSFAGQTDAEVLAALGPTSPLHVGLVSVWKLSGLTTLSLYGSKIRTVHMQYGVSRLPSLTELDLVGASIADRKGFALLRRLPKLIRLNVQGCRRFGDAGLEALSVGCPRLRSLNITGAEAWTVDGLATFAPVFVDAPVPDSWDEDGQRKRCALCLDVGLRNGRAFNVISRAVSRMTALVSVNISASPRGAEDTTQDRSAEITRELSALGSLRHLRLLRLPEVYHSSAAVEEFIATDLGSALRPSLSHLLLERAELTSGFVTDLVTALHGTQLITLRLDATQADDATFVSAGVGLRSLEVLSMQLCPKFRPALAAQRIRKVLDVNPTMIFPALKTLCIAGAVPTDSFLDVFTARTAAPQRLEKLRFGVLRVDDLETYAEDVPHLTVQGLMYLKRLRRLRALTLTTFCFVNLKLSLFRPIETLSDSVQYARLPKAALVDIARALPELCQLCVEESRNARNVEQPNFGDALRELTTHLRRARGQEAAEDAAAAPADPSQAAPVAQEALEGGDAAADADDEELSRVVGGVRDLLGDAPQQRVLDALQGMEDDPRPTGWDHTGDRVPADLAADAPWMPLTYQRSGAWTLDLVGRNGNPTFRGLNRHRTALGGNSVLIPLEANPPS